MTRDFAQPIRDHKPKYSPKKSSSFPHWKSLYSRILGVVLLIIVIVSYTFISDDKKQEVSLHEEWLPATDFTSTTTKSATTITKKIRLKSGDSALVALKKLGFSYQDVMNMGKASQAIYSLAHVKAGQRFERIQTQHDDDVWYDVDSKQRLHFKKHDNIWLANMELRPVWHRQHYAEVTIHDSLFLDARRADIDSRTIMNLIDMFAWDIDFARELRRGDHFRILYDSDENREGKQIGSTILAAEFVNQGRIYSAMRYTLAKGKTDYYSFDGKSLRKTYLKAPVKFSRISSRFTTARKHPILGYTRAHKGVDYAAPKGTPIHAIGDGRIIFAAWNRGYGRLVKIRHTNRNHSTRYGHMSKFGRGIHRGVWVKQGQIIGYVGMSGLATGPHLHFEFRVRGRAMNPLSVKHTPAKPVPKSNIQAFKISVEQMKKTMIDAVEKQRWG
ncbi:MAG: peptidoglycan DD-metalloendopeptidase family protein [Mariprofundaceae bacterium]|nr:peptidoglycan DD-metalloendopeptidase family protein [Mariprofundaceae bacterium]